MSRYRKTATRFWKDEKVRTLEPLDKLIANYGFTGQSNRIGVFTFSPGMAADDTGIPYETFQERFRKVCQTMGWLWDEGAGVVYLPTWWKYNQPENSNNVKGNLKDLDDLPHSPLVARFCSNLTYLNPDLRQTFTQTLVERYPKRLASQEQEQEQETTPLPPTDSSQDSKHTQRPTLDELVEKLGQREAYRHLDVRTVLLAVGSWCETNGKVLTERRAVNCLNKELRRGQAAGRPSASSATPVAHDLFKEFRLAFERKVGAAYVSNEGKDLAILDGLLVTKSESNGAPAFPPETLRRLVVGFFRCPPAWVREKNAFTVSAFKASFPELTRLAQQGEI